MIRSHSKRATAWALLLGGLLWQGSAAAQDGAGPAPADDGARREARRTPVVQVFENSKDAVVNIAATQFVERRGIGGAQGLGGFGDLDAMFEDIFDMPNLPRNVWTCARSRSPTSA